MGKVIDQEIEKLDKLFSDANAKIERKISYYMKRIQETGKGEASLAYLEGMKKGINETLFSLQSGASTWAGQSISNVYQAGITEAHGELKQAGIKLISGGAGSLHEETCKILADNVYSRLSEVCTVIGRQADDYYRAISLHAISGAAIGYDTWKEAAGRILIDMDTRGITAFKDKLGRKWKSGAYAAMVGRTSTMEAHLTAKKLEFLAHGEDLIKVSYHLQSCEKCEPYQSKILSISGANVGKVLSKSGVTVFASLEDAKANGLFHPNCRHSYSLYLATNNEDLEDIKPVEPAAPIITPPAPKAVNLNKDEVWLGKVKKDIQAFKDDMANMSEAELSKKLESIGDQVLDRAISQSPISRKKLEKWVRINGDFDDLAEKRTRVYNKKNMYKPSELMDEAGNYTELYLKLEAEAQEVSAELSKLRDVKQALFKEFMDAAADKGFIGDPLKMITNQALETMKQIREFGVGDNMISLAKGSRSWANAEAQIALGHYPRDWIDDAVSRGYSIRFRGPVQRGCHMGDVNQKIHVIKLSGQDGQSRARVMIHELGHFFEEINPSTIQQAALKYRNFRTSGESIVSLKTATKGMIDAPKEWVYKDKWFNPYVGRDYKDIGIPNSTEITSMGASCIFKEPYDVITKDMDFLRFTLGVLSTL